uniref:Putative ovule protein n=1 Tax=Solanum chacoense TaxID=4108 RepID=A0A0V0GZA4_SOLCH
MVSRPILFLQFDHANYEHCQPRAIVDQSRMDGTFLFFNNQCKFNLIKAWHYFSKELTKSNRVYILHSTPESKKMEDIIYFAVGQGL